MANDPNSVVSSTRPTRAWHPALGPQHSVLSLTVALVALAWVGMRGAAAAYAEEELSAPEHSARARAALADGNLEKALEGFREAEVLMPEAPELAYNQGVVYYRMSDLVKARELFNAALTTRDLELEARAKFNLGNCAYATALAGKADTPQAVASLRTAIRHYLSVLDIAPDDEDARANIELAQLFIKDLLDQYLHDCNTNGIRDEKELAAGTSTDCNENGTPDECDIARGTSRDCNKNGIPDECDLTDGLTQDCNTNGVPDDCEPDCNTNGVADSCDIAAGTSLDADTNGVPDECPQNEQQAQQQQNQDQEQEGDQQQQEQQQSGEQGQEQQQNQPQAGERQERRLSEAEARRLLQAVRDKERQRRDQQARLRLLGREKVAKDW